MKKKLVVFTGAGMSAESGISTFRDSGGLWEQYQISEVATPEAWQKNPKLVLDFYNARRKQIIEAKPNKGHKILVDLEQYFDVQIITQNIDDLHERAGSKKVLHLHGEILKARSTKDFSKLYSINGWEMKLGDCCELGSQLRPHIVWFGEQVPLMSTAYLMAQRADYFIVTGTSLAVYPAAGIVEYVKNEIPKFIIDPNEVNSTHIPDVTFIKEKASIGLSKLALQLIKEISI